MPALAELQRAFCRALLEGDEAAIAACVEGDGLAPAVRLAVYRNNVMSSLAAVLKDAFPVVCRLVDERFFDYAAHEFIKRHLPERPRLAEYGAAFPDFLAGFPPSQGLAYLPDVARLEWLMHAAADAAEATALEPAALARVPVPETPRLRFRLHPSLGFLASRFPIDRIWRANRPDADAAETIELDAGGARLEVGRRGADAVFRTLPAATFVFRLALHGEKTLKRATEAALEADASFDLATAFADLFRDGAVAGFSLDPPRSDKVSR